MTGIIFENEFIRQGILLGNEFRAVLPLVMDVPAIIQEALTRTGLTQAEFGRKVAVAQGTISKWLSGQQSPNKSQWDRVTRWLARNPRTRDLVETEAEGLTFVPILSWVSAGSLVDASSQIPAEDVPLLAFADLGQGEFFALKVEGTSMNRASPDGSIIIVNKIERELIHDKCYVFSVRGETTYKKWYSRDGDEYLASFSFDWHPPIPIKKKKDAEVIGRVKRSVIDL